MISRSYQRVANSIVAKLWLTIIAMVVLVLLVLTLLLQQFFSDYIYQNQTRNLLQIAQRIERMITAQGPAAANAIMQQVASVEDANIRIGVPYSSQPALVRTYHSLTAEQQRAFDAFRPVTVVRKKNQSEVVAVYLAIPGRNQQSPGMVAVSQQTSVLREPLVTMRNLILSAMGLGVVLATGLAFVVSKNLSRPLLQMNEVAEEMAKGNFSQRIHVVTNDEVGRLGRTFNSLAAELADSIQVLSMERDQLSGILSSLEDGVLATDLEGHITLANPPAVRRLTSLILAETGTAELSKLPQDIAQLLDFAITHKGPLAREVNWQGRHLDIRMTPLYEGESENLRAFVFVLRDVTEERTLDRLRKDFIANVSHELRTPLSMMQGYTEALLDEFGDDPEQRRELTAIIHDETLRMRRLVNSLLDLAQLESGHFQMKFTEIEIAALVRWTLRKFQTLAAERGVRLTLDVNTGPAWVLGDEDRLAQVFTNLVDNAIQHTEEGGEVRIVLGCSERHVNIRVSDTGSGIPEEDLPYIWERFYKADKARTRTDAGIGLGLAITRHIVLQHNGDIIVESQLGHGTTFTVAMPLAQTVN